MSPNGQLGNPNHLALQHPATPRFFCRFPAQPRQRQPDHINDVTDKYTIWRRGTYIWKRTTKWHQQRHISSTTLYYPGDTMWAENGIVKFQSPSEAGLPAIVTTRTFWLHSSWGDAEPIPTRGEVYNKSHGSHDDVIKWKHFPRYWPCVRGIHRSPVNSSHKGQWRGALMFLICAWINGKVNNRNAGELWRHRPHYDVTVMYTLLCCVIVIIIKIESMLYHLSLLSVSWSILSL